MSESERPFTRTRFRFRRTCTFLYATRYSYSVLYEHAHTWWNPNSALDNPPSPAVDEDYSTSPGDLALGQVGPAHRCSAREDDEIAFRVVARQAIFSLVESDDPGRLDNTGRIAVASEAFRKRTPKQQYLTRLCRSWSRGQQRFRLNKREGS